MLNIRTQAEVEARDVYDREPVKDMDDARALVNGLFDAVFEGKTPTARQCGFALWLLWPIVLGEGSPRLPFKIAKRKGAPKHPRGLLVAIAVHYKRAELNDNLSAAIAAVAGNDADDSSHEKVRKHYERHQKKLPDIVREHGPFLHMLAEEIVKADPKNRLI